MKGLNKVELIGNLGSDPEMRYTPAAKAVTTFSMATSRKYTDEHGALVEDTQWHNIVCWEKLAESCKQALCKGSAVYVSGRINYRSWDGNDGVKHYRTEIIAGDCIFLDKPAPKQPGDLSAAMPAGAATVGEPV